MENLVTNTKNILKQSFTLTVVVIVSLLLVFSAKKFGIFLTASLGPTPSVVVSTLPSPTIPPPLYPDYDVVQSLEKKNSFVELISNGSNRKEGSNKVGDRVGYLKVVGKFARAYLYIEASANNKPISKFESVYMILNYTGGHLVRSLSLPIPQENDRTRLLYALNEIPVISTRDYNAYPGGYSEEKPVFRADWFSSVQKYHSLPFQGFLASNVAGSLSVKLYYECEAETVCSMGF